MKQPVLFGTLNEDESANADWLNPPTRREAVERMAAISQQKYCFDVQARIYDLQPPKTLRRVEVVPGEFELAPNLQKFSEGLLGMTYAPLYRVLHGFTWVNEIHRASILRGLAAAGEGPERDELVEWAAKYQP